MGFAAYGDILALVRCDDSNSEAHECPKLRPPSTAEPPPVGEPTLEPTPGPTDECTTACDIVQIHIENVNVYPGFIESTR